MSAEQAPDANTIVSHEDSRGRVLSGVGADAAELAETMERHAPPEKPTNATAGADASTAPETVAPSPEAPAAPSRGRQRFSDLTREREEARAEAAAAKAERETLARELAELKARPAPQPEAPKAPEPPTPAASQPAFPPFDQWMTLDGNGDKDFHDYMDARADHRAALKQAESQDEIQQRIRAVLQAERQHEQMQSVRQAAQDRARKAYPDYDALLKGPAGQIGLGRNEQEGAERLAFIFNHPQSEHIQYAILKDAKLAEKLRDSDPYTFGVTVAGLVPAPAAARPAWTPPPAPYATVGASSPTTPTPSSEMAEKGDYEAYRAKRAVERGVKSRYSR